MNEHGNTNVGRVTDWLNRELALDQFQDDSHNGLQVGNSGRLGTVCAGVDASMEFFEAARDRKAGLLICHHGLSWGTSLARITGLNYRLISFLVRHDMALWACHLPLDAHPRWGNNARLAQRLGLCAVEPFGAYHGRMIGVRGTLPAPLDRETLAVRLRQATRNAVEVLPFGSPRIETVGIVSGGAAAEVSQADEAGLDAYISGEPTLLGYNLARQLGVNAFFAGHYATECFGPRAVAAAVRRQFAVPACFIRLNIPY